MPAKPRAKDVCPRVACPKEDEHRQGVPIVICHSRRGADEAQRVERCEWQGNVELCHEGHRPCLHRVSAVKVEFRHQKVDDGYEVRDKYLCAHHVGVERPHRCEEVCRRYGGDEAVDVQAQMPVGDGSKLPCRQCCDSREEYQQREGIVHDACNKADNEEGACNGTKYKVFHLFRFRFVKPVYIVRCKGKYFF